MQKLSEMFEKLVLGNKKHKLTVEQLAKLVRDFQADCHDGFVSNDEAYIEQWLHNNKI